MSEHTKKRLTSIQAQGSSFQIVDRNKTYIIPKKIVEKFIVDDKKTNKINKKVASLQLLFKELDKKYTKAGALLKGLRAKENLSQIEFAKKINVTQANLSNMESGRRSIGKIIAKRIEKAFGVNYRYFLE